MFDNGKQEQALGKAAQIVDKTLLEVKRKEELFIRSKTAYINAAVALVQGKEK